MKTEQEAPALLLCHEGSRQPRSVSLGPPGWLPSRFLGRGGLICRRGRAGSRCWVAVLGHGAPVTWSRVSEHPGRAAHAKVFPPHVNDTFRNEFATMSPCSRGSVCSPPLSQSSLCSGLRLVSFPQGCKLATHHFFPFYRSALLIYWKFTIWKCSHIN